MRLPWNALLTITTALLLAACAPSTQRLDGALDRGGVGGRACATAARRQLAAELDALSARFKDALVADSLPDVRGRGAVRGAIRGGRGEQGGRGELDRFTANP